MLGNDVVDLADVETQPEAIHPRFDERVFTSSEHAALAAAQFPRQLRWMLWAAKESAYKASKKVDSRTVFSPKRFVVVLETPERATVEGPNHSFSVLFRNVGDLVHAIAVEKGMSESLVVAAARRLNSEPGRNLEPALASREVRVLAVETLSRELGLSRDEIEIVNEGRLPRLRLRGVAAEVSLSHHGRFVAFAASPLDA